MSAKSKRSLEQEGVGEEKGEETKMGRNRSPARFDMLSAALLQSPYGDDVGRGLSVDGCDGFQVNV